MARKGGNPDLEKYRFKKGDSKAKECQKKSAKAAAENRKKKATTQEIAMTILNSPLTRAQAKQMQGLFTDLDIEHLTMKSLLVSALWNIAIESERDVDKMQAIKSLLEIIGESPELTALKQAEQIKQTQYEDDELTKSLKELLK